MELAGIIRKYSSDKDRNCYSHLYSMLFDNMKNDELNVLKIGIGDMILNARRTRTVTGCSTRTEDTKPYCDESDGSANDEHGGDTYIPGSSIRAWGYYFPNSIVYGVDLHPDTQFEEGNIKTYLCSSIEKAAVDKLMEELGIKFNIIIDDTAQIASLSNFFPYLKDDGIYVIENIYPGSSLNSSTPTVVKDIIGSYEHYFVGETPNQCVIKKRLTSAQDIC